MKKHHYKAWTVTLTSGPLTSVKQFRLSKLLFYCGLAVPVLLIAIIVGLFFQIGSLSHEKKELYTMIEIRESEIEKRELELEEVKEEYITLEKEALAVERSIEEFKAIEERLNQLDLDVPNPSDGSGGIAYSIDYEEHTDVPTKIIELREELPSLITDFEETYNRLKDYEKELRTIPTLFPAAEGRISSNYGKRKDPFTRWSSFHSGTDVAAPLNTPIYAAADGIVESAGNNGGYGLTVTIKHNETYETLYAHLNRIDVNEGDKVKKGDVIGGMGTTGRSTGVHLHYEIKRNGEHIDPYVYMTFHEKQE